MMTVPELTRKRILTAYAVAIVADLIEFPIAALELTVIGAPVAMFFSFVLDAVVFGVPDPSCSDFTGFFCLHFLSKLFPVWT